MIAVPVAAIPLACGRFELGLLEGMISISYINDYYYYYYNYYYYYYFSFRI